MGIFIYNRFEYKAQGKIITNKELYSDGSTNKSLVIIGSQSPILIDSLPNLILSSSNEQSFVMLKSVLSDTSSTYNLNIALTNADDTLILSTITRNDALTNIPVCYTKDEYFEINSNWARESEKDENGKIVGYNYVTKSNLINNKDPQFEKVLSMYLNELKFKADKTSYTNCNTSSRYNEILYKSQAQGVQTGLVRIFVNSNQLTNKVVSLPDLDDLIRNSKF